MRLLEKIINTFCLIKARKVYNHCSPFLNGKVLDVGAGRCYIAKEILKRREDIQITCLDIIDLNKTDLKLSMYDGEHIPFEDNSFDVVLLVYVLHHCKDPMQVLKECKRVAKKRIIIFEDTSVSAVTKLFDYVVNKVHGVNKAYEFNSTAIWCDRFNQMGLTIDIINQNVEKEWFYPVHHTMFVLKK